jgi:hypothetical protein
MQQVTRSFRALPRKVPQILAFEGGPDVAFGQKSGKFTHCFVVTVQNEKELAGTRSTRIIKPSAGWPTDAGRSDGGRLLD